MSWHEERRRNLAAEAEQQRLDRKADYELRRQSRRDAAEFEREQKRRAREEKRRARDARRKDRKARRAERARTWTPEWLYGRSTYTIVAASAAASLPAQFMHFGHISPLLLTIPVALEGAAWATFAGVAYADEKRLHPGVRSGLRGLSLLFASFAAWINWLYGKSLAPTIGEGEATVVAAALAAVTMLGPLLFEVRQWVRTLSASSRDPKQRAADKARARHAQQRAKMFKAVAKRQRQILLAAPFGRVDAEEAWRQAWADIEGAQPGVTATVVGSRIAAEKAVSAAVAQSGVTPESAAVELLLAEMFPAFPGDDGPPGGSRKKAPQGGQPGGGGRGVRTRERDASEEATTLGGKGKRANQSAAETEPERPLDPADIARVRTLAEALGGADKLSARKVREAIGCRTDYAIRLRDRVQADAASR
ncbi:hypothetical protein H3146_06000 [Streptomyces sp. OF3]|uniref:DUF2637 domain-containing protein n=1 Tax=Streptomyces alkaliterrae TaxID=2213162 RepID=A0A7W3WIQ0_9ACTN|nr:hypothetical protein [Streptomyces alkaliterrae]MBB1252920.1 hypothetical protein [Streptomyces alkaliterrae]